MSKCSSSCAEKTAISLSRRSALAKGEGQRSEVIRKAGRPARQMAGIQNSSIINRQSDQALPGFRSYVPDPIPSSAVCRPSSGPILGRLRAATRPIMVQAAPGKFIPNPENPQSEIGNDTTLARWSPNGDGTYSPIPFTEPMMRVNSKLLRLLGFQGQWQTLDRLGRAGFVEMLRIAPKTTLINLNSYYNHLARCAEDPEFWSEQKKNLSEYRKSI